MLNFRITIPVKVSLLVLSTVLVSVLAFSIFIFFKVKNEEEKNYSRTVVSLGLLMGEQIWHIQEEIKRDMTNILAMTSPDSPARSLDSIRIILQKNPQLVYFELAQMEKNKSVHRHKELISLFNSQVLLQKSVDKNQVRAEVEKEIEQFSKMKTVGVNYYFKYRAGKFPIYIFELDKLQNQFAAFALDDSAFTRFYNPTSPVDIVLANDEAETLFSSSNLIPFPVGSYLKATENRTSNQGHVDNFKDEFDKDQFATHFYRAADGLTLITFKSLGSAGLNKQMFFRDVVFFFGVVSLVMLLISLTFSKGLSDRIRKLMGLTENIAAGNYQINVDHAMFDEVGDLANQFRLLGERLGEKEIKMERVTELANRDGLTGVYNSRYFKEAFLREFEISQLSGRPLSLVLIDIDLFKRFNDEYGHQQGDIVIQQLAHLLGTLTRKDDVVARFGGDEFSILLKDTDIQTATAIAERIREAFENKRISRYGGLGFLSGTCSIGVSCYQDRNFTSPDEFLKRTDDLLYYAKKSGRNKVAS